MLEIKMQIIMLLQLFLSMLLGGLLGLERELSFKSAGIRTFAAVCVGSCLFGLLSIYVPPIIHPGVVYSPERIAAQVVSGIGFLGAGLMFREGSSTQGLTTAATLWASAAVGIAVAFSLYIAAIGCTSLLLLLLFFSKSKFWAKMSPKSKHFKSNHD